MPIYLFINFVSLQARQVVLMLYKIKDMAHPGKALPRLLVINKHNI